MKPKTMILMGLAIACGLGAAIATSKLVARGTTEEEMVNILVARKVVNVGDPLKKVDDHFTSKAVTAREVPEGAIRESEMDVLKDKVMKKSLRKGDHITRLEVYGPGEQLDVPEGHEAVGLRVTLESSASGFASLPRSRVNVLLVAKVNNNDIDKSYVQVLLQDVLVLAADIKLDRDTGIVAQAQVVTLALKSEDVQRVTGASAMGELKLSLRRPGDASRVEKTVMTFREIKDAEKGEKSPLPVNPPIETANAEPTPPAPAPKIEPKDPIVQFEVTPPVKTTTEVLIIGNGSKVQRQVYRYDESGRLIEEAGVDAQAAPANPAAPNQKKSGGPTDA